MGGGPDFVASVVEKGTAVDGFGTRGD